MLDAKFYYGFEFMSCNFPVVLTPLTERCFLSLTQAIKYNFVGCLVGPTSTGKTQTIKGFSYMLGKFLISLSCLQDFDSASIGRIFTGIGQEGAWCLFDELQQASSKTLSVITFYAQHILNAIKSKQEICYLLDSQQVCRHKYACMYSKNPHIRNSYSFEMGLPVFLCDEVLPIIRILVLNTGYSTRARKRDS